MAASTNHVRKRQYQPSLDSYFARNAEPTDPRRITASMSPPVPAETQASLLSVGMRVRKSVPEGYKTHKTLGLQGEDFPSSAPSRATFSSSSSSSQPTRELMPFCGLHKTGGWASQEVPLSSAPARMRRESDTDEDVPRLSMSQSTAYSTHDSFMSHSTRGSNSKKRTYEDDAEDEMDAFFDEMDDSDTLGGRQIAPSRPVARLKSSGTTRERRRAQAPGSDEDDFVEASFLSPMEVDQ